MQSLTKKAYAKINLFLDVLGLRPDGYHNIKSIMEQVSLCDTVTVSRLDSGDGITVTCTDPTVPTDERNIVYKCAVKFFEHFGIKSYSIKIDIEKNIPSCGGLAGGSTDGAAVLNLLNDLFGTGANAETLCKIGAKVGADIPFCIVGGTCLCEGIGEIITPVEIPTPPYQVLISFPGEGISTPEAYRTLDTIALPKDHVSAEDIIDVIKCGKTPKVMYNAFEYAVLPCHENARIVKKIMLDFGAVSAMMSGSGSTIFGLFDNCKSIEKAKDELQNMGFNSYICTPV